MIERRPFESLGGANHGWLDAKHHFSFASYYVFATLLRVPLPVSPWGV